MLSSSWTSALFSPHHSVISLHFSPHSLLCCFACIPAKAVCVTKQLKEPGQGAPGQNLSLSALTCHLRTSCLQWHLHSEGHADSDRTSQAEFSLCYHTLSSLWPLESVSSASSFYPSRWTKAWESGLPPTHPHCFSGNILPAIAGVFVTWQVPATLQREGFMDLIQFCDEVAHMLAFLGQTGFWGRLHWWRLFVKSGAKLQSHQNPH